MRILLLIISWPLSLIVSASSPQGCATGMCPKRVCQTCQGSSDAFQEVALRPQRLPELKALFDLPKEAPSLNQAALKVVDLGVLGKTFEISELSMLELIQTRLKKMEDEGRLEAERQKIQHQVVRTIKHPKALSNINHATTPKIFLHDPTFEVVEDLYDHERRLIHAKGQKINPLDYVSFGAPLIFIDGRDPGHVVYAKEIRRREGGKITLVAGAPLDLSSKSDLPIYFDQGGSLTRKFGIKEVPAVVRQKGNKLEIEVVAL